MSLLSTIATRYAECCEWLEACPFTDGQPFYETAAHEMEEMSEAMVELAQKHHQHLLPQIEEALTDGEWNRMSEVEFWKHIAKEG